MYLPAPRNPSSDVEDLASALLRFENGMTANLTASRVGQQKIRELRITQPDAYVTVDLVRQDVTINRVEHAEFLSAEGARVPPERRSSRSRSSSTRASRSCSSSRSSCARRRPGRRRA